MQRALCFLAAAAALAGCAAGETAADGTSAEKQYRTGSHIPDRTPSGEVKSISKEEMDKARDSSLNPGTTMPTPRAGSR